MAAPDLASARWRTSSFSTHDGTCVEVADLDGGHRAVRDSKNPADPALTVTAVCPTRQCTQQHRAVGAVRELDVTDVVWPKNVADIEFTTLGLALPS